jgi:predicted ATP-dependent serine protease
MEMDFYDIAKRLAARVLEMPYDDFDKKNLFADAKWRFERKKLFISNGKDMSLEEICAVSRRYHKEHKIRFLFVDYDQKLVLKLAREEQEWRALQKAFVALESLAKELEIHVMVMAQVNREGLISGSQRAIFPASTVLSFHQDEGKPPLISTVKNRFGSNNTHLEVEYRKEMNVIREKQFYVDTGKI